MSHDTPWASSRLLIPVTVDALVVTKKGNATEYSIQPLALNRYESFGNLSPNLFVTTDTPKPGIYLNWAIPDGMTHGVTDDNGRVSYPYLPNRWMVIRFSADPAVKRMAWVVESDWRGDKSGQQDDKVNPQIITEENGNARISYIGKWYNLDNWSETGKTSELFLTAIGNSDPMFAAYSGNSRNVFSFTDAFDDEKERHVSYQVCGWYSNPAYDILYNKPGHATGWDTQEKWLKLMAKLQWSAGEKNELLLNAMEAARQWMQKAGIPQAADTLGLCAQTLCHGLVFDVVWPGMNVAPPSSVPVNTSESRTVPYVAAANAATDCLAAFMQWQLNYNNPATGIETRHDDKNVEVLLEAFSHKMLPQPGGVLDTPELRDSIRESWFGHLPGGSVWLAQPPKQEGDLQPGQAAQPPVTLPVELASELAALNEKQRAYDSKKRQLASAQKDLYATWLKLEIYRKASVGEKPEKVTEAELKQAFDTAARAVKDLMTALDSDKRVLGDATTALRTKLNTANKIELVEKPANDFYQAGDPVFLINNAKRSFKRGEDIIYSDHDEYLFVRFTGQFISSIEVETTAGKRLVKGSDICPVFPQKTGVPAEIPALLEEAYLLDTSFAAAIANKATDGKATATLINTVKQQQTLVWNADLDAALDRQTLAYIAGFNLGDKLFHVPSKIGVWKWIQPWTPLYMEWEIGYYPCADTELRLWQFDGTDYKWKDPKKYPPATVKPVIYRGRAILTPKEAITLQAKLKEFIHEFPDHIPVDYIPLQDVLTGIKNWDVLSQALSGFSRQLMQWDIEQFGYQPKDKELQTLVGDEAQGMPVPRTAAGQFFPVRAGFVSINRINVVDDFGQVYNLTPKVGQERPKMRPIPGIGMRPGAYQIELNRPEFIQLPPRLIQAGRLNFNFVSADNDTVLSSQVPDTTPVAGWVLPNHLDNSVMVYDNSGELLGEIILMGETGAYHAEWLPAPVRGKALSSIQNKHLQGFIKGLLGQSGAQGKDRAWSGDALKNFIKTIDETLWTVDPMGERSNQSLSVLVGRPIAIVRASVSLELNGTPAYNLAWSETGKKNTGNIEAYKFPVQIGSIELAKDGVLGYFAGSNYATFNSVHNGQVATPAKPPYVENTFLNLQCNAQPSYITMLLDPRGGIHCSSGILPVLQTELPEMYIGNVLDNMLLEFRNGPLLVPEQAGGYNWWMPLPAGAGLKWSWLNPVMKNGAQEWQEIENIVAATPIAGVSGADSAILEGRLKLAGALGSQVMILFFQVNGMVPPYEVAKGTDIVLSWSTQGAKTTTLKSDTVREKSVPANSPAYTYKVLEAEDTIILTITDGNGNIQSAQIKVKGK